MISTSIHDQQRREFLRDRLRSDFVSVFWSAIQERKRGGAFKMQHLADALGRDKSVVSKWFSNEPSNWQVGTIADIADALDLDLVVKAKDRKNAVCVFTPFGMEVASDTPSVEFSSPGVSTHVSPPSHTAELYRFSAMS